MADFPTTRKPSYSLQQLPARPEVLITTHKDGSEQRRLKGAGPLRRFELRFGGALPISTAEKDEIMAHYAGQNGALEAFNWTYPEAIAPADPEVIFVRYEGAPQVEHAAFNLYRVTLTFQEVPA